MAYTQDNRLISIETPLGKDALLLGGFTGSETLSRLFSFELSMISENHGISFENIIGKNVTLSVVLSDQSKRYFNGIVSRFSQGRGGAEKGGDPRFSHYRATMVPWLWLLTRTADSRIFQKLSVPDIVEKIFKEYGFSDFRIKLQGSYDKRDYCVQYRETDFDFISRLIEEEGIHYFFEHEKGKHTLVLADSPQANAPCPKQAKARYQLSGGGWLEEDVITNLERLQEIRPAKYTLNDFNFEIPNSDLKVNVPGKHKVGPGEREIYDYPGSYGKRNEGDRLARIRMEEEEAQVTTITGAGNCRSFTSGYRFALAGFYRKEMDKEYLLCAVEHEAQQGWQEGAQFSYENRFTCIPYDVPFRPLRLTPRPTVLGSQTAIVVGPGGEEIYTDEHGRVKVQFHWDREGKRNENSSCWIRVAQLWAGAGWGGICIPRIGHEVIVDFLEGDPDRPIVTGRVYHGTNKPPYGLPGEKTKSTIKSNSSQGGGGFNELRFEDKKGSEEIFLHGQKDWTIAILHDKNQDVGHDETHAVKHDETHTVGHDETHSITHDHDLSIGNNRTKFVKINQYEKVGVDKDIKVGGNHTEDIVVNMSRKVGGNKNETVVLNSTESILIAKELSIGGLYQVTVGAAMNETVVLAKAEEIGAAKSVNVVLDSSETVGVNKSVEARANISESAGQSMSLEAVKGDFMARAGKKMLLGSGDDFGISGGKTGTIDIKDELTIKCGKAVITLNSNGNISIEGQQISIDAKGNLTTNAKKIMEN